MIRCLVVSVKTRFYPIVKNYKFRTLQIPPNWTDGFLSRIKSKIYDSSVDFRSEALSGPFCQKGQAQTIFLENKFFSIFWKKQKIVGTNSVRRPSSPPGETFVTGKMFDHHFRFAEGCHFRLVMTSLVA